MIKKKLLLSICVIFLLKEAHTEAFGNNGINVINLGLAFFDSSPFKTQKEWGINNQFIFSTSYFQAFSYKWWWKAETAIGIGKMNTLKDRYLTSIYGGAGIRYDFTLKDIRPYSELLIHYLHFLGKGAKAMPLNLDWPIFVGPKALFGFEWYAFSEMSFHLSAAYAIYINVNEPFRQVIYLNTGFNVYF